MDEQEQRAQQKHGGAAGKPIPMKPGLRAKQNRRRPGRSKRARSVGSNVADDVSNSDGGQNGGIMVGKPLEQGECARSMGSSVPDDVSDSDGDQNGGIMVGRSSEEGGREETKERRRRP
jgi:hypothetical protein